MSRKWLWEIQEKISKQKQDGECSGYSRNLTDCDWLEQREHEIG